MIISALKPFVDNSDGREVGFGLGSEHTITQTTSSIPLACDARPGSEGCLKIKGLNIQKTRLGRPPPALLVEGASLMKQEEPHLFAPKPAWFPSLRPPGKQSKLTALGRVTGQRKGSQHTARCPKGGHGAGRSSPPTFFK